ncbi:MULTISPECIES: energy-coupling factor transporter transmembrane component T [unclassified Roseitalea]|uniref:energy-coupling factor transporter transmembrane component T family protein n=1 Tax=unclassified Roseitalea TaxID=2639107 RepID=UPI00273D95A4|nr:MULTISPECIES: energy-coupling factor transporter transmembrane component T [unclassified Roseitalea]
MLSALHPLPKLVICMAWIVASILVFDLRFQLATIAVASLALIVLERRSPFLVLALMVPFALFGFGFFTTSVLFRQDSAFALKVAAETPFGAPAVSAGLILFFRAIACGMASAVFALTTDPGALIKALMVHWRLPPQIGFALFQALQLVPDLGREMQQIRLARAMRRGRPPRRVPGPTELVSLIVPLLAYAIRRAGRSALAMEARGLAPGAPRTVTGAPALTRKDAVFSVCAAAVLLVAIVVAFTMRGG